MKRVMVILLLLSLSSMFVQAQEKKAWPLRVLYQIKEYIDSSATKGIDRRYIEVPERPWQIMLRSNMNDMYLESTTNVTAEDLSQRGINGELHWKTSIAPKLATSIGIWAGYRGYGFGYSFSVSRSNGRNFSIGATGANYGFDLRTRRFETNSLNVHTWGVEEGEQFDVDMGDRETWDPITVRSSIFDAFYCFNGKRFSYAAAYDQSSIQLRSAGSLMLGVMWFQTSLDFSERRNALLIQAMGTVGRIKIHEGSIGIGYSYNWVPVRNLLINISAMPMVSPYNRTKVYTYDSNYDIFLEEGDTSPTGKKAVPDDGSWTEDITITETGTETRYGRVALNFDARMSITYQFDRYIFNVNGQYNHYHYKVEEGNLKLSDWFIKASLGIRL